MGLGEYSLLLCHAEYLNRAYVADLGDCTAVKHNFDTRTHYCLRCGVAEERAFDEQTECIDDDTNVFAISHIISRRALNRLFGIGDKGQ